MDLMFNPVVCFEKQGLTAEATNPLTSLWRSLTCALTAFHSCNLVDLHTVNTPFCCIFKATAASLIQTSTAEKNTLLFLFRCANRFKCFILTLSPEIVPLVSLFTLVHPCVYLLWLFSSSSLHQL